MADFTKPGGQGEALRGLLIQHAATQHNWLEQWWDNSYLDIRMFAVHTDTHCLSVSGRGGGGRRLGFNPTCNCRHPPPRSAQFVLIVLTSLCTDVCTPFCLCPAGDPSPVNVNYGLQLKGIADSQTVTAAKLIAGAIDYKLKLDKWVHVV